MTRLILIASVVPLQSQDSDAVKVWITCLSKCEELLGTSARVFASVQEAGILEEIVQAEEGRNKLRGETGHWSMFHTHTSYITLFSDP